MKRTSSYENFVRGVILLILSIGIARAQVYVSEANGTDTTSCGAQGTPCQTLQYIFSTSYAGIQHNATIYISSGTYDISNLLVTKANLTLQGTEPGVIATMTQQNVSGFTVLSNGEIHFDSISFQDMSDFNSGILVSVECSIQVTKCTFRNMSNFNNFVISPISAGYFYFANCTLEDLDTNHYFIQIQSLDVMLLNITVRNANMQGIMLSIQSAVSIDEVSTYNLTTQSNLFNLDASSYCHLNNINITNSMIDMAFALFGANTKNVTINALTIQNSSISQITDYSTNNGDITFIDLTLTNVSRGSYLAGNAMIVLQDTGKAVFDSMNVTNSISKLIFASHVNSLEMSDVTLESLVIGNMTFDSAYVIYGSFEQLSIDSLQYSNSQGINNPFFISAETFTISNLVVNLPMASEQSNAILVVNSTSGVLNDSTFDAPSATYDVSFQVPSSNVSSSIQVTNNTFSQNVAFTCMSNSTSLSFTGNSFSNCKDTFDASSQSSEYVCAVSGSDVDSCTANGDGGNDDDSDSIGTGWYIAALVVVILFIIAIAGVGIYVGYKYYQKQKDRKVYTFL